MLLETFFSEADGGIFQEISCEKANQCDLNQILFKGVTSSWLLFTALLAPGTYDKIMPKLEKSAVAAAKSCSGKDSKACGVKWFTSTYDGTSGMEQQISTSDVITATLARFKHSESGPVTSKTGGNSSSNPDAGKKDNGNPNQLRPITTGDRVGAGFVTLAIIGVWTSGIFWLVFRT